MSLDDVLAAWASSVRLDEATAAEMYQRIVHIPRPDHERAPGVDAAWWRGFTADCATWMVTSNRPARWTVEPGHAVEPGVPRGNAA